MLLIICESKNGLSLDPFFISRYSGNGTMNFSR
jgi:hypothetical protein